MEIDELLSKGLEEGYAGTAERQTVRRGPFQMETSQYTTPNSGVYRDEWIADIAGGGQEIVEVGDQKRTRLYSGGTLSPEELAKIGLTKKDVTNQLKKFIRESRGKTRLYEDYEAQDGNWEYSYLMGECLDSIDLKTAMESISYKGTIVFAHGFINTPIK